MRIGPQRPVNPDAIVAPQGYRVEALVTGLSFPSAISFGPGGELYLAERGGIAGCAAGVARVLRIDPDQSVNEIGRLDQPIVGLVYRNGGLLIGEDGPSPRILRVTAEGELQILLDGLPGGGDYGLSGLALDAGGGLLFGIGTRTNSGVVGLDNVARGWVAARRDAADIPGADVELAGVNYVTSLPWSRGGGRLTTGSFRPLGSRCDAGDVVRGAQRCSGGVYRLVPDHAEPELLAWGLRSPVGITADPEGRIFLTEGGMEERGSRPIAAAPDNLWEIEAGGYYGWPDHASGIPVTEPRFRLPGHPQPRRLLAKCPRLAGTPAATFAPRSGVGRLDFSTSESFGFAGDALVALSGAWSEAAFPADGGSPAGHRVVRVNPRSGDTTDFLVNRQGSPSSSGGSGGLERPFDIRFDPTGEVLYVVDLGEVHLNRVHGLEPYGGTGIVWRITRIRSISTPRQPRRGRDAAPEKEAAPPAEERSAEEQPEETAGAEAPEAETSAPDAREADTQEAGEREEPGTPDDAAPAEDTGEAPPEEESAPPEPEAEPSGDAGEQAAGEREPDAPAGEVEAATEEERG